MSSSSRKRCAHCAMAAAMTACLRRLGLPRDRPVPRTTILRANPGRHFPDIWSISSRHDGGTCWATQGRPAHASMRPAARATQPRARRSACIRTIHRRRRRAAWQARGSCKRPMIFSSPTNSPNAMPVTPMKAAKLTFSTYQKRSRCAVDGLSCYGGLTQRERVKTFWCLAQRGSNDPGLAHATNNLLEHVRTDHASHFEPRSHMHDRRCIEYNG